MSREVMQQALEALEVATTPLAKDRQEVLRAISVLHKALAQPLPGADWSADMRAKLDVYMAQPEQEPVGEVVEVAEGGSFRCEFGRALRIGDKLYTSPPQRQPLTDEEIKEIFLRELGDLAVRIPPGWRQVVNAIEASHGIGDKT